MTYFTQFSKQEYILSDTLTKQVTNIAQYTGIFSRAADDFSFYTYYNARPDERLDNISNNLYDTPEYYWTIPLLNSDIVNTWRSSIRSVPSLNKLISKKYPGKALIADDSESVVSKFGIGDYILYNQSSVFIVTGVFPTQNYIRAEEVKESDIPSDIEFAETENLSTIVGTKDNESEILIASVIDAPMAPARFVDSDGNSVPWYVNNTVPVSIAQIEEDLNESKRQLKVILPQYIESVVDRFNSQMRSS